MQFKILGIIGRYSIKGNYFKKSDLPAIIYKNEIIEEINEKIKIINYCELKFKRTICTTGKNNPNFGRRSRYMNKDGKNKMVLLDEVDEHLLNGWKFGIIGIDRYGENNPNYGNKWTEEKRNKLSETQRRIAEDNPRYWIHNEVKSKMVHKDKINSYLSEGWKIGRGKIKT